MSRAGRGEIERLRADNARLRGELTAGRVHTERLQRIIDVAPVGIVRYDLGGGVEFINRWVLDVTGAADADDFRERAGQFVHPDDVAGQVRALRSARLGRPNHYTVRVVRPSGEWVHLEGSFLPTRSDGHVDSIIAIFHDVSHQIEQTRMVARFTAITEVTTDIVGITTVAGEVVYLNPAGHQFMDLDGDHPTEIARFFDFIPVEYHPRLLGEAFDTVMRGQVWQGEVELLRGRDLARCPMSAVVVGIRDDAGELIALAVTYRDLSERKRFEAELAHGASHDSLTGLANRQELLRSLDASIVSGAATAVLFFDLDDFKVVNDSLGHAVGDTVLCELGDRIRDAARGSDVVGRLGGDEFLIICRGVSSAPSAMAVADKILTAVAQPLAVDNRPLRVTGSIGIALSAARGATAVQLVQEADIAMYRAKRAGRGRAMLFDDSMRVEAVDRLELHRELRLALERDELELHFQPLVYFGRDVVQNFEALIRWRHPRHGLLGPLEFLPVIEQVGLTEAVGQWVFAAACRAAAAMRAVEPEVCVGVNVHPDQIRQPGFVEAITRSMEAAGVPGAALAIEITEHAVMADVELTRQVLEELRALGIAVAIDDFGTGYSNLDLLRRLPVDFLKIDQSFVAGLGVEPSDMQLVRMILGLSSELGITVIAEGVETELQASELVRLGCTIAQGYLYSRPLTFDDAMERLRAQRVDGEGDQHASPPSRLRIVPVM
ncbi:MAG: diguanylate cyclase/phosphodiesterase with and sensor(s) [Ilumatobacteraceae bacterium]|nr:diguanylate cyclase/phosphodiesterase with and sensor(s) [Ilumatobacteraceae bacterium]